MTTEAAHVLLHPDRLRIVLAVGSEQLTTSELAERLPDIAHATLYRQVAVLAKAGVLEVVDERRVRGGLERRYALAPDAARLGPGEAAQLGPDELLRGFTVFAGSLIEAMGRYLDDPRAEPGADVLGFRQAAVWLDEEEAATLIATLREVLGPYLEQPPTPRRQRVLFNTILIPDLAALPPDGDDERDTRSVAATGSNERSAARE